MVQEIEIQLPMENLPKTCIYTFSQDNFSELYDLNESCECGNSDWVDTLLLINIYDEQIPLLPKKINRCCICQKIRMGKLKKYYLDILDYSDRLLKGINKLSLDNIQKVIFLKNVLANLEVLKKNEDKKNTENTENAPNKHIYSPFSYVYSDRLFNNLNTRIG